jgi:branched-chain amino acid transport system ATP-binding protein
VPGSEAATNAAAGPAGQGGLLEVSELRAGYAGRDVVYGVDFKVGTGEIVTLLGHNGAGKTTTLRSIFGLQRPSGGSVRYAGRELTGSRASRSIRAGISFVPAERFVFADLSVVENLELGALTAAEHYEERVEKVFTLFPVLAERTKQLAGTMSGGQQRMLSLGMALMTAPRLMLLDEPSLGLSPKLAEEVMDTMRNLVAGDGVSVLLVEQNVDQALRHADRAYVMRSGRIIADASAEDLRAKETWWDLF